MTSIRMTSSGSQRISAQRRPAAQASFTSQNVLQLVTSSLSKGRRSHPAMVVAATIIAGMLIISVASLLLNIATSQGVYELAKLKSEKKELAITSQIISEQVDSLSSDQNLSSAASQLGMVANTNPVFLRIEDQKIFGRPKAALNSSEGSLRGNLVPNASQVKRTSVANLLEAEATAKAARAAAAATKAAAEVTAAAAVASDKTSVSNVAKAKPPKVKVTLTTGEIPASPTN